MAFPIIAAVAAGAGLLSGLKKQKAAKKAADVAAKRDALAIETQLKSGAISDKQKRRQQALSESLAGASRGLIL